MTQVAEIARSLMEVASTNPMAGAIAAAGLAGGAQHGARAALGTLKPFALLTVAETDHESNTAGVSLVTYRVGLSIIAEQRVGVTGAILGAFHRYWDRLALLPTLDPAYARFVLIHPESDADIGELDQEDLGKDLLLGSTAWSLVLSEHSPAL